MPRSTTDAPDRLRLLLAAAERLTVDLITQAPVTVDPASETPWHARDLAEREGFDVLPVLEGDGRIVRYVRASALKQHAGVGWQEIELVDIHPDDLVASATPLLELVTRFSHDRPRLFVLGRSRIDGTVS